MAGALWAEAQKGDSIVWRKIQSIADDPDQPWNPRLQLLAECGFGYAAAIPFSVLGEEGIVVAITRKSVNMDKLQSETNEAFLMSASQLIGSTFVFRGLRKEAEDERKELLDACWRRARYKILALRGMGFDLEKHAEHQKRAKQAKLARVGKHLSLFQPRRDDDFDKQEKLSDAISNRLKQHANDCYSATVTTLRKFKGAGVPPPPPGNYTQATWTLVGTFLSLAMLTNLNGYLASTYGMDHTFALA